MKNLIMVAALFLATSIGINAQTAPVKQGMKDLRQDVKAKRQDKRQLKAAVATGNKAAVRAEKIELKGDRRNIAVDRKNLKAHGVKHPVKKAKRQIRRHKLAK